MHGSTEYKPRCHLATRASNAPLFACVLVAPELSFDFLASRPAANDFGALSFARLIAPSSMTRSRSAVRSTLIEKYKWLYRKNGNSRHSNTRSTF